ncbi:MAG: hypothetical protein KF799_15160 [Bdellovibrionales bacterium]|nr:hypothetical protein [Bdellovibrionales bacterium]
MSLEELLRDTDSSSAWKGQRKKLLRIVFGIAVAAMAVVALGLMLTSFPRDHRGAAWVAEQDKQTQTLSQLMRVQKEAEGLQQDLKELRQNPPPRPAGFARVPSAANARGLIVDFDPGDGFTVQTAQKSDIYIPTGSVFQAQLLTPIKTSVDRTFVMAETTNEFRMDSKRRIAKGSRLIGRSRLNPVLKGVVVEFDTIVSPAGLESSINGLALSRNALPEIEGLYFSDKILRYGTAMAFGFLSGFADAGREREYSILGSRPQVNVGNQALAGLSIASFQVADEILRDIQASAVEYVVVPAGERVFVVLTRRYEINQGGQL